MLGITRVLCGARHQTCLRTADDEIWSACRGIGDAEIKHLLPFPTAYIHMCNIRPGGMFPAARYPPFYNQFDYCQDCHLNFTL